MNYWDWILDLTEGNMVLTEGKCKGVRAFRGYFVPPMRSTNKSCSSKVSSYLFIRTIAKV